MQYLTFVLAALTTLAAATPMPEAVQERGVIYCGSQPYYPEAYTCYKQNNNLLCPILSGTIYQPCGKACFNPSDYGCTNGQLVPVGKCNGQVYDKNSYVCANGNQLCPKAAPNACGKACFDSKHYWCKNGVLQQK
ncbi:hypothetical protein BJ508DRAFT_315512 [Ascobolus immersus RN42]|uniref:Endo-1,3(4)-beta-glucanase 1 carbohydrate binding domain-containing protein n=1 Tax=Ascobolus immersus RN42 TaxID=1160509 RepID=A0A3N4HPE8_ASCIM|nr:hypothetical protein BJ508DRAFT_315512 [Ascobolus immersus RN42]